MSEGPDLSAKSTPAVRCYLHPLAPSVSPIETAAGPRPACWQCLTDLKEHTRFLNKGKAEYSAANPAAPTAPPSAVSNPETRPQAPTSSGETKRLPHEWPCRVVDGDTIAIDLHPSELDEPFPVHVRILGIDAPERGTPEGRVSTEVLQHRLALAENKVRLESDPHHPDRDKWGRLLRHAWSGDILVGEMMLAVGAAALDDRFPPTMYDARLRPASKTIRGK